MMPIIDSSLHQVRKACKSVDRRDAALAGERRGATSSGFAVEAASLTDRDSIISEVSDIQTVATRKISRPDSTTATACKEREVTPQSIIRQPAKVRNGSFETEMLCAARKAFPCSDISPQSLEALSGLLQQGRECYIFSPALHALLGLCFYATRNGHNAVASFENSRKEAPENKTALLYTAVCAKSLLISVALLRYQTNAILRFKESIKSDDDSFTIIAKNLMQVGGPSTESISSLENIYEASPLSFAAAAGTAFAIYQASREGVKREAGSKKAIFYAHRASEIRSASPMVPVLLAGALKGSPVRNEAQFLKLWPDQEVAAWAKRLFCGDEPLSAKTFFSFSLLAADDYLFQRSPFV